MFALLRLLAVSDRDKDVEILAPQFLIRDREGKLPGLAGAALRDAGIEIVLSGSRCRE